MLLVELELEQAGRRVQRLRRCRYKYTRVYAERERLLLLRYVTRRCDSIRHTVTLMLLYTADATCQFVPAAILREMFTGH